MKKFLTTCLLYLILGQNSFAQTPHFRSYTVDDGLPSSLVYRAFQDSKGFIWFCTDKGLARFDGYKFEKFTTKNGLPNNDIWQCAEDSHQRIWFLSYANAFFYFDLNDNKFHSIPNPVKEQHDNHIWCYIEEPNGIMKAVLNSNVANISIDIHKQKVIKNSYTYNFAATLIGYPIGNFKVIKYIKDNSYLLRAYSESLHHNILHKNHIIPNDAETNKHSWNSLISLAFDDDKTIFVFNDSISYFKNNRFYSNTLKKLSKFPNDESLYILNTGDNNQKLVITKQELFILDKNLQRNHQFDFIKDFNVNTVFFDSEKNVWICTKNQGLLLLSKYAINSNIYSKFASNSITTLTKDPQNRVWFGTNTGRVFYINTDGNIKELQLNKKVNFQVKKIQASQNGVYIVWNTNLFTKFPFDKLNSVQYINASPINVIIDGDTAKFRGNLTSPRPVHFQSAIKSLTSISSDKVLLANTGKLFLLRELKKTYTIKSLLNYVKTLAVHVIGKDVYAGTNKGLIKVDTNLINDKNINFLKQKYPILSKSISCFAEDNQKALWAGTDGYGVYRLKNKTISEIPELGGIIINHLYFEKENNRLFVSTNEGIFVLKLILKGFDFTYLIKKISLAQGLPTLEVNAVVVRNQDIYVASSAGLVKLPLKSISDNSEHTSVPLIIKNIKINRQDTTITNLYDLNYRQNNLDIEFVALSYKSDKNIKYDYKMLSSNDNSDTTWHSVQDLHKEFSLLSPGKYQFHLRAFDIDGNPSNSIKPIVFIINPPFWETLWFRALITLVILSLLTVAFYIRTRNIKKKEQEKTEVNKKFAELELQALQAQMNPHFVFNALSAIQNFILNNNTSEATDYLSRFSRLMRLFLESSRNKYIALSDEKTLLEHYIKLEELRFKDKFSSKVIIADDVSMDTEIPSMLIQPFVENAINHGLVYKENNNGLLNVIFTQTDNKLICVIEDNGIGRTKAAEIKSKSLKPYKSRSTEITEDRLRSLELIENTKIEITILDKIDENQVPQGTKVTIVMYL